VDRWKFREDPNLTEAEKDDLVRERLRARYEEVRKAASNYQIRRERAKKLKSMKKYMFGKFLLRVPRFSEDLFKDIPLPQSYAKPFDKSNAKPIHIERRIYGQDLSGDMIPMRSIQAHAIKGAHPRKKGGFLHALSPFPAEKIPLLGRLPGMHHYESIDTEPPASENVVDEDAAENSNA